MVEIQQADARSRKVAILVLIAVLICGAVLVIVFEDWLVQVRSMPVEAARESLTAVFRWSVGMGAVAVSLAGCHFWWSGRRVRRALRFPLPGATVLRDTIVLEGRAAASRGRLPSSSASCSSAVPSPSSLGRGGSSGCLVRFMTEPLSRVDPS